MKKLLCVVLSVLLLMTTCVFAVAANEDVTDLSSLPEKAEGTNRYFFYVPEEWNDENSDYNDIYIYWWTGSDVSGFPGYIAKSTGTDGVFYYDVPKDVTSVLWNNGVYETTDDVTAYRSANYNTEYYESHESRFYPEGTDSFDGMIYVADLSKIHHNATAEVYNGELFYYYGNGEYGLTPDKADASVVLTGDTIDLDALYEKITAVPEATADEATKDEATKDEPAPIFPEEEKPYGTNRYYFYLPDQWVNDYAYTAGIYWWEGSISGEYWPGNEAKSAGVEGVYYYDVATDTPTIIWNNYLDGGTDSGADIYTKALQTIDIPVSVDNYDGMIFVVDLSQEFINSYNGKVTYGGEWYYYYGSGMYGTAAEKADADEIFTDKSFGEWATPDETPTEPVIPTNPPEPTEPVVTEPIEPTTAETEPTEAPTETSPTEGTTVTTPEEESSSTEPTTVFEPEFEIGDANMDGKLNIRDATLIQKYLAKLLSLSDSQKEYADFDLNGKVNVRDVTAIQKKIAGLI